MYRTVERERECMCSYVKQVHAHTMYRLSCDANHNEMQANTYLH
jgi:hypothetical protein